MSRLTLFGVLVVCSLLLVNASQDLVDAEIVEDSEVPSGDLSAAPTEPRFQELYPQSGAAYNPYAAFSRSFDGIPTGFMSAKPIFPLKPTHVDIVHYMNKKANLLEQLRIYDYVAAAKKRYLAKEHARKVKKIKEDKLRKAILKRYKEAKEKKANLAAAEAQLKEDKKKGPAVAKAAIERAVTVAEKMLNDAKISAAKQADDAKHAAALALEKQRRVEAAASMLKNSLSARNKLKIAADAALEVTKKLPEKVHSNTKAAEIDAALADQKLKADTLSAKEAEKQLIKLKAKQIKSKKILKEKLKRLEKAKKSEKKVK